MQRDLLRQLAAEALHVFRSQREACRAGMAAMAEEEFTASRDGIGNVYGRRAAGTATCDFSGRCKNDDGWSVELLDQASRDKAENARVPVGPVKHKHIRFQNM